MESTVHSTERTAATVYTTLPGPLGELLLVGEESPHAGLTLTSLSLPGQRRIPAVRPDWRRDPDAFADAARQLDAYFDGRLRDFDLPFAASGTVFQQRVWDAVDRIPYGTTTTYGRLAEELGVPREDIRALGAAIGANPLLVVRPCHRVIGADGTLKGYAGGLEAKRQLLTLEGVLQPTLV
ncbi:methylated-DNA--[protein]-cysteine S-methyltransferase [Yinghuangia seranimata]|uniref:methylated-DNA--[protein]-cysteine S-methyltransferase n=1 Tax=Yinghuangia seranimata TaxID=408067 RepID=UPI00248AF060|nr:methylated-DNA--[protein]-cysteine S-methyltransferase [Yinghuangia seranimata]MDI2127760.1 methylated-DNA--[protein]-cysteine S-methyltransferase [Yinghuangia seranimata]